MLKIRHAFTFVPATDEHYYIVKLDGQLTEADTLGLAFVIAVYQWIIAQEHGDV